MPSSFKKELAWLCLPVLLLGGAAWFRSNSQVALLHIENPFAPGPMRLEYSSFNTMPVEPREVSNGFDWKTQTMVRSRGTADLPKNWRESGRMNMGDTRDLRLIYRRGKTWFQAKRPTDGKGLFSIAVSSTDQRTFLVNLKTVPLDANEVRMRGRFEEIQLYSGPIPTGWKPFKDLRIAGPNRFLTIRSEPFDVQIKGEGEPMPAPVVSKEPQIEVVDGKWLTDISLLAEDWGRDVFVLQLRRKDGDYFADTSEIWSRNLQLFDADGKKIALYDHTGDERKIEFWHDHHFQFSPDSSNRDYFAVFLTNQFKPTAGWVTTESPLRLRGEIGIGGSWPQKIDVEIEHLLSKTEKFGATK